MIKRAVCFLCQTELEPVDRPPASQIHPLVDYCETIYTDDWGVPIDVPDLEDDAERVASPAEEGIALHQFQPVEDVIMKIFDEQGLPRLGGASSGKGWSNYATYQRCPYAWRRRYIDKVQLPAWVEPEARTVGTLVHLFLALHYANMMPESPYVSVEPAFFHERLRVICNPAYVAEGWRLYKAYELYYRYEQITPLLVEHDLRDPRTGESCRYDLVAFFAEEMPNRLPGTYILEHKTSQRFDWAALNGWQNDGECLGEVALWKLLGMDKRWGELRGLMVNLIGRQKEPKMHRTIVAPSSWQIDQHLRDLKRWESLINLSRTSDVFPRARAGCITRFGSCEHWEHCLNNED